MRQVSEDEPAIHPRPPLEQAPGSINNDFIETSCYTLFQIIDDMYNKYILNLWINKLLFDLYLRYRLYKIIKYSLEWHSDFQFFN